MKTNTELIEDAKKGSQRAFTSIYNSYSKMVYVTIMGIVRNKDIADDLVSEVFLKIFRKIESFKKDVSFQLWMKTIAVNHAIDYVRKSENKREMLYIDDESEAEFIFTDLSNPETDMIKKENIATVRTSMDHPKGRMGEVLRLRFDDGLKYRQIAEKLNINIGTVKHYIHRSKERVKKETLTN